MEATLLPAGFTTSTDGCLYDWLFSTLSNNANDEPQRRWRMGRLMSVAAGNELDGLSSWPYMSGRVRGRC